MNHQYKIKILLPNKDNMLYKNNKVLFWYFEEYQILIKIKWIQTKLILKMIKVKVIIKLVRFIILEERSLFEKFELT